MITRSAVLKLLWIVVLWTACGRGPGHYKKSVTRFRGNVEFVAAVVVRDWHRLELGAYAAPGSGDVPVSAREMLESGRCIVPLGAFGKVLVGSERTKTGEQMVVLLGAPMPGFQLDPLPATMFGIPIEYRFDDEWFSRKK